MKYECVFKDSRSLVTYTVPVNVLDDDGQEVMSLDEGIAWRLAEKELEEQPEINMRDIFRLRITRKES